MIKLVIAEKPSAAKSIAAAIGAVRQEKGFVCGNGYIVSWCFGHLAGLAEPDSYDEKYGRWKRDDLPIIPEYWQYSVDPDKQQQFDLLCELMAKPDVTEVINACDAGREGELIFRTVYMLADCEKPVKRLWISSMEDEAVREGFANLKDGKEYDGLYSAALCRSRADWIVGINATRLFSVLYHRTLSVGRVVSPTLALLVEREAEISAFKSEPIYTVSLDFGRFSAVSDKFKEKGEAEKLLKACEDAPAVVKNITAKTKAEKAPALFDLTSLQREANRLLGFTAQQTLDYLQSLYEKKLVTYPRTDSRYLTDEMESSVPEIVKTAAGLIELPLPERMNAKQICDSGKVSDHHALVPTLTAGRHSTESLPSGEREILNLVAKQTLISVCDEYRWIETSAVIECGGYDFKAKGKVVLDEGWKAYLKQEQKTKELPELSEGAVLDIVSSEVKEGRTEPPQSYTDVLFC